MPRLLSSRGSTRCVGPMGSSSLGTFNCFWIPRSSRGMTAFRVVTVMPTFPGLTPGVRVWENLRRLALYRQHNFAEMSALFHHFMCCRGLLQGEAGADQGFDRAGREERHHGCFELIDDGGFLLNRA